MSLVQKEYERLVDAMTPAQRVERAANMLVWARSMTERRIIAERGEMSVERLKWEVALEFYGHEPIMRNLIEKAMSDAAC